MTALATPSSLGSASAAPARNIDLARRAGKAFPLHTMIHGFALHANGRVVLAEVGPKLVLARVRAGDGEPAGRVEGVRLEAKNERLLVGCSCPARSFGLLTCKHSWAVLLEADLKHALGDLRTSLKPCVVESIEVPAPEQEPADEPPAREPPERGKKKSARRADAEGRAAAMDSTKHSAVLRDAMANEPPPTAPMTKLADVLRAATKERAGKAPRAAKSGRSGCSSTSPAAPAASSSERARRAEELVDELLAPMEPPARRDTKGAERAAIEESRPSERARKAIPPRSIAKAKQRTKAKVITKTRADAKRSAKKTRR